MSAVRAIVTDIEGTTSAISFVHDVLFPYADARLDAYVASHRAAPAVANAMREAAQLAGVAPDDDAATLAHLHAWIAEDRKATPLKALEGLIWEDGYARGELAGHIYPDVAPVLRAWHAAGIALYVYSSGSIVAQQVLFGHSVAGDVTPLFSGYFDTTTGPKRERASYEAIAEVVGVPPGGILFLSDVDAELDAARAAGWQTARLLRPADTPPGATTTHPAFADFSALAAAISAPQTASFGRARNGAARSSPA